MQLKISLVEQYIQKRQLGWLGHVVEERLIRSIYEVRPMGKNNEGSLKNIWKDEAGEAEEDTYDGKR